MELIKQYIEVYSVLQDNIKLKAYKKAQWQLAKGEPVSLTMQQKIAHWEKTGKCPQLEKLRASKLFKAFQEFTPIIGVGPATINKWVTANITTVKKLAASPVKLNKMQQLGLKYYDDLKQRIPRDEITAIAHKLQAAAQPHCLFTIAGSYRRKHATSGDIDILLASETYHADFVENVAAKVRALPEYIDTISQGKERFSFLYQSERVRQIDFLYLPKEVYWAGLLYFTGSYDFNEWMRGMAKKQGKRLNQNGLFAKGKLIPTNSEMEIFYLLNIDYIEPEKRELATVLFL